MRDSTSSLASSPVSRCPFMYAVYSVSEGDDSMLPAAMSAATHSFPGLSDVSLLLARSCVTLPSRRGFPWPFPNRSRRAGARIRVPPLRACRGRNPYTARRVCQPPAGSVGLRVLSSVQLFIVFADSGPGAARVHPDSLHRHAELPGDFRIFHPLVGHEGDYAFLEGG